MRSTSMLRRRLLTRDARVAVVGQGYVGLSLACAAAEAGFEVTGIDVDADRVDALAAGQLTVPGVAEAGYKATGVDVDADRIDALAAGRLVVPGVDEATFKSGVATGRLRFTTDDAGLATSDVICICVPTPVRDHTPDLSYVEQACREVARHLVAGRLVVLESSTYPGTTNDLVAPLLEASGQRVGRDFLLAYSPERIDPGNGEFHFGNTPRIVGGTTAEATAVAALFYEQMVSKVVPLSSARAAELAKLLENTFRHVNIALVNEMAMVCHELGIDVWEVIEAAASKPFGFMAFTPGPGVGGHCIPLDPTYLAWQVRRDVGHQFRILEQAQDVNAHMPGWVAARIGEALNERAKPLKGARVLVLGVAYKPDVGDVRESPSLRVMQALGRRGAKLAFHDPFVEAVTVDGRRLARTELTARAVAKADLVALLTPHSAYDLEWLAGTADLLFDARNALGPGRRPNLVRL